jgi:hypothetical protein
VPKRERLASWAVPSTMPYQGEVALDRGSLRGVKVHPRRHHRRRALAGLGVREWAVACLLLKRIVNELLPQLITRLRFAARDEKGKVI